jgi:hypothetical protein
VTPDESAVGCTGTVIVATRGEQGPGEVLVNMRGGSLGISGGGSGENGTPFQVVTGHGAFVVPFVRQASFLRAA